MTNPDLTRVCSQQLYLFDQHRRLVPSRFNPGGIFLNIVFFVYGLNRPLRNQGLNEEAARFVYRAQIMQRVVFRRQRKIGRYFGSLIIDLLAGYGYKPWRSFPAYLIVIGIFALLYYHLGTHLAWTEAIVISMTAFHGRGFFPDQFHPGDPQALVAAIEAFVGLLIEVTFISTLTQRLFGR